MNKPRTVITYGTFDMFHIGHKNIIRRAKELANGGKLIVGVTTEAFNIERGKTDVQDSYEKRCENVMATGYVDEVIPDISFPQKEIDIKTHNVDLVVMGHDWEGKFDYCKDWCDVVYLQRTPEISTTILKEQMREGLSKSLNEELRERYNPEGSVLRRQQMRMLDILLYVDKFCKEHNIRYWLSSGTLLGAVRHGGFIPWDDDLDIEMMREDFLRFKKLWKDNEDFILQSPDNDLYYTMPYLKIRDTHSEIEEHNCGLDYKFRGIFIDVFALEPTHKFVSHQTHMHFHRIRKYIAKHERGKFVDKVVAVRKFMAFQAVKAWRVLSYPFPGKQLRHTFGTWCYRKPRFKEDLFPLTTVKFEGYDFPAPHNSDAYLRELYGDYMAIPTKKDVHIVKIEFL